MSYSANLSEALRLVGLYTGRILKGEKPADLPVQRATKVELIINLRPRRSALLSPIR
jgi:putative ABC transport system substrate-binding protein